MPLIVRWAGGVAGGSVSDVPVITPDLYPTLLDIAGIPRVAAQRLYGETLVTVLRGQGGLKRDALFWHYPHYQLYQQGGTVPYSAIRAGDFKLIEFHDGKPAELYNLREDIGEQRDLARSDPAKAAELTKRLAEWRREVGAQMPTKNPAYDRTKPEHDVNWRKQKR